MRLKKITALLLAAALIITANPKYAFATEVELANTEDTSNVADNATSYTYVRSAKELISALNGKSVSGASVKIEMQEPYSLLNDEDYTIVDGDVDLSTGIVVPENTDITMNMYNHSLAVSDNLLQSSDKYLKIVVPKSSRLTITSSGYADLPLEIENHGNLMVKGTVGIDPLYGNGILNTGSANIEEESFITFNSIKEDDEKRAPILNLGGTVVINTDQEISTGAPTPKDRSVIINKDGNLTIEKGSMRNFSTGASGNAILNEGSKAVLEIRGGQKSSSTVYSATDCGIVNNGGKVSILEGTRIDGNVESTPVKISAEKIGILTYNGGSLTMYSGNVYGGTGNDCAAIATTPYIDSSLTGTVSEGSVKILGGQVGVIGSDNIGIAYSGDALPVLLGGEVRGITGAVVKYASAGTLGPVTTYQFRNSKNQIIDAYTPAEGANPAQALTSIIDGLNPYASQSISFNGTDVDTFAELQAAVLNGGNIRLTSDISVTESLSFKDGITLYLNNHIISVSLTKAQLTIEKDANVKITGDSSASSRLIFYNRASGYAGLVNLGTLSMNGINTATYYLVGGGAELIQNSGALYIENSVIENRYQAGSSLSKYITIQNNQGAEIYIKGQSQVFDFGSGTIDHGTVIYNEGKLELNTEAYNDSLGDPINHIYTKTLSGTSIANTSTGTTTMKGETRVVSLGKDSIAVKNQGTFIMESGYVGAQLRNAESDHSYAIAYEGDKLPQLIGGRVEGSYADKSYSCTSKDGSKGAAVNRVTNWNTFATEMGSFTNAAGVTTSGLNSSLILNGIPNKDAVIYGKYGYLLMEKGEVVSDCAASLFNELYAYTISNNVAVSSTSQNVVSVSTNAGKYVATAVGTGMTMLRMELKEAGISDYIRVEVVEDREKLLGENYQGNILEDNFLYNAYRESMEIPLEWHLKDSYDITSGEELNLSKLVEPKKILLESQDPEFKKYFKDSDELEYNEVTKQYSFELEALSNSNQEYNYLVRSEIKGFSNIHAKLLVEVSGRTETIDMGTFDILVDDTEPKFEYNTITLNSAFTADTHYMNPNTSKSIYPNNAKLTNYRKNGYGSIIHMSYPNGFSSQPMTGGIATINELSYTGTPKKGSYSIPVEIYASGYNGYFESKIPVKVINDKPTAELVNKSVIVAKTTSDATDIPMLVTSKTVAGVGTISKVEIVGNNSSFAVVNSLLDGSNSVALNNKKYVHDVTGGASFYLQPRKTLTKAEKVTLRFSYQGAGNHTTTTTVNIVPKELKKASMKAVYTAALFLAEKKTKATGELVRDYDTFYFTTTPSNYEGGYFVVTGLNGTGLDAGKVQKYQDGMYSVKLCANDSIKAGKKQFLIYWYDKEGNVLGKPLKGKATIIDKSELTIPNKNVVMDFNKANAISAKVKWKKSYDWNIPNSLNPNFEVTTWDDKGFTIQAKSEAIYSGAVLPGKTYTVDLRINNFYGDSKKETIQVAITDIKDIKVKADDSIIYKNAPYTQSLLYIYTSKPNYGMSIINVKIKDAGTPFEVRAVWSVGEQFVYNQSMTNGQEATWSIALKDNQYNSKMIGKQKVNLEITYQNGKTVLTQMTVTIK